MPVEVDAAVAGRARGVTGGSNDDRNNEGLGGAGKSYGLTFRVVTLAVVVDEVEFSV